MKNFLAFALFLTSLSGFASDQFKTMNVKDLTAALADHSAKVAIYDANNEDTRNKDGIIPGAKLLSSSSKYNVKKELTPDHATKLVFYCANQQCTASHKAAERAAKAGYTDVNVMVDGIQGWKKAGQPTEKPGA